LGRRAVFADAILEMMKMTNPKIFEELHDAYIIAVEVDHLSKVVSLRLRLDTRIFTLIFDGATRFLLTEMVMQNIVYSISILEPGSRDYIDAAAKLENTYWKHELKGKQIAFLSASLGAEMYIEYDSVRTLMKNIQTAA
jgi:hypothetical protein